MCSHRDLVRRTVLKKAGETSIVLWISARESRIPTSRSPNQNRIVFWQIFSSNKSAAANGKTEFFSNIQE